MNNMVIQSARHISLQAVDSLEAVQETLLSACQDYRGSSLFRPKEEYELLTVLQQINDQVWLQIDWIIVDYWLQTVSLVVFLLSWKMKNLFDFVFILFPFILALLTLIAGRTVITDWWYIDRFIDDSQSLTDWLAIHLDRYEKVVKSATFTSQVTKIERDGHILHSEGAKVLHRFSARHRRHWQTLMKSTNCLQATSWGQDKETHTGAYCFLLNFLSKSNFH